ncbi:hypothetical protein [Flavobacterium myungsuense]|uniref:Uncharacterized protein n=1 Tax=Flavobacterium myungsuense TaxID=651823 RepID=A0ABW3J479_9FLAO
MNSSTYENYTEAIKAQYDEVKEGMYASFLLQPTPAQLRNLCVMLLDHGLSKADEGIFTLFFQVKEGENLRRSIENFDVEKFKAVKNFLTGKNTKTNPNSLNLIAVLVNFNSRPFSKFIQQGATVVKKTAMEVSIQEEESREIIKQEYFQENVILHQKKPKARSIAIGVGVIGLIVGSFGIKKEYFPDKECVQWNKDHYEEVVCEGSKIGFADVNPIIEGQESLLDFKKIEVSDTTTFFKNKQPVIWYCKQDGKCEYFNAPGLHPESGKTLKPISKYIIKKYVLQENKK